MDLIKRDNRTDGLEAHGIHWRRKYNAKSGPINQRTAVNP
jgi:hypothetical protein